MAIESQGSKVKYGTIEIGEVLSIGGPSGSAPVIPVTHLTSTAAEKLMGVLDEGQVAIEVNYVASDAGQVEARTHRASRESTSCRIFFGSTTGPSIDCSAYCTGFALNSGVNQQVRGTITLEITGACTYST